MAKSSLENDLKRLQKLQELVDKKRESLAKQIGYFVLQKNPEVLSLQDFKAIFENDKVEVLEAQNSQAEPDEAQSDLPF